MELSPGVEEAVAAEGIGWAGQESLMPFDDPSNKTRNCHLFQVFGPN